MKPKDFLALESLYTNKISVKNNLTQIVTDYFVESQIQASSNLINKFSALFEQAVDAEVKKQTENAAADIFKQLRNSGMSPQAIIQLALNLKNTNGTPENIFKLLQKTNPKAALLFQQSQKNTTNESLYCDEIVKNAWIKTTTTILTEDFIPTNKAWISLFEELTQVVKSSSLLLTEAASEEIVNKINLLNQDLETYLGTLRSKSFPKDVISSLTGLGRYISSINDPNPTPTPVPTPAPTPVSTPNSVTTNVAQKKGFWGRAKDWVGGKLKGTWEWIKNNKWKTLGAAGALAAVGAFAATGGFVPIAAALAKLGTAAKLALADHSHVGGLDHAAGVDSSTDIVSPNGEILNSKDLEFIKRISPAEAEKFKQEWLEGKYDDMTQQDIEAMRHKLNTDVVPSSSEWRHLNHFDKEEFWNAEKQKMFSSGEQTARQSVGTDVLSNILDGQNYDINKLSLDDKEFLFMDNPETLTRLRSAAK